MILENLQDLELDHSMQKLSQKDYNDLKMKMMSEAASIYQSLEQLEKEDPLFMRLRKMVDSRARS
jgi:hypothetical protein